MKNQVYDILLMPIVCDDRKRDHLERRNGTILTGQTYCSSFIDEDMSDFAVGFYQVVYGHLWGGQSMLDGKGYFRDWEFAGDTMNSFNTTARKVLGKEHPPETEWPIYLRNYFHKYHCLANFWVLPLKMGRTLEGEMNKTRVASDYMDRYLQTIKTRVSFNGYERRFFNTFTSWNDFVDREFLRSGYLDAEEQIISMSQRSAEEFVGKAICAMEKRARDIAESEHMEALWTYFEGQGLLG